MKTRTIDSSGLTKKEIERIKNDRAIRQALARSKHQWFFLIYFGHYITYPFAPFHYEMFRITEDELLKIVALVAFRNSGKTTLMTTSFPIWSIIGKQRKKFVLILSQTQSQAKMHLANIRRELEGNDLLKADIGPFEEESNEWGANSIVLSKYDARITAASTEQGTRGIRHGAFRPDLVICDDIEDLTSIKTKEGRDKTFDWLNGEILPIGDQNTRFIIVGNLLHEDSSLMRLRKAIDEGSLNGKFFAYPLLDDQDRIAWPGKFKTLKDIENLKKSSGSNSAWFREYLLRIIPSEGQIVYPNWLHYYDVFPDENNDFRYIVTGVDPAIGTMQTNDYTAMVSARVYKYGDNTQIFILPNPVNERLEFPDTVVRAMMLSKTLGNGMPTPIAVEDVAYQRSLHQQLQELGYPAEGIKLMGQDKRARAISITYLIKAGRILFPKNGAELLIQQLLGYGVEKHDDLVDALIVLVFKVFQDNLEPPVGHFDDIVPHTGGTIFAGIRDKIF